MFVELNPGYTHEQAELMPHNKMLHYLSKRIARGGLGMGALLAGKG